MTSYSYACSSLFDPTAREFRDRQLGEAIDRATGYIPPEDEGEEIIDDDTFEETDGITPAVVNPNLTTTEDQEFREAQQFLEGSLISYIHQHCPTEVGYSDSLYIAHDVSIPMNPDLVPAHYYFCITIPKTALVEGASTFGDFDRNTNIGRAAFREFEFFRRAFCDPMMGDDIHHDSAFRCPRESYICNKINGGGIAPKVIPIVEPLFHKALYAHVYPSNCTIPTYEREIDIVKMLVPDNIVGYRVWFFVIDKSINALDTINRRIARSREEMGMAPQYVNVSELNHFVAEVSKQWLKNDPIKTFGYLTKINTNARQENARNAKARKEFQEQKKHDNPHFYIHYEITRLSEVYNFFRCHESRCLECKQHVRCQACENLPMGFVTICNDFGDSSKKFVYKGDAKFEHIPRGSMLTTMLDGALVSNEADVRAFAQAFIDPIAYMNHTNPTAEAMLNFLKVCSEQINHDNYVKTESQVNEKVKFAFPTLVFTFNSQDFHGNELLDVKLPWAYDLFDIMMECVKEVVDRKRKAQQRIENQQFFDSIVSAEAREQLFSAAAISASAKRMIPMPIPIQAQGVEYNQLNQQFAKPMMAMPNEISHSDERIIRGKNEIRDCALEVKRKITALRSCVNYIGGGTLRKLLEILQKQGMRNLKRLFIPDSETPYVVRAASIVLLDLVRTGKTAYAEMSRIAHNLNSYSADFLLQLYFYFEGLGVVHNHNLLVDLWLGCLRASHCPITDGTYNHTSLLLHPMVQGTAGVGKSFAVETVASNMMEGSFPRRSSASNCSMNRVEVEDGRVFVIDEIRPGMDPGKAGTPEDAAHISMIKELITAHCLDREVTQMSAKPGGGETVADRTTVTIHSEIHNAIAASGNDLSIIPGEDDSFISRFVLYIINAGAVRKGTVDLTAKATPFGKSSITRLLTSPMTERQNVMIQNHALHVAYAKGVAMGAFVYPCLDMLSFHFIPVYKHMLNLFPSIGRATRTAEKITSKALALAIANGIHLVFNTLWSPLVHMHPDKKEIEYTPFSLDQLTFVQPCTFLPEDLAIGLIVEQFHMQYIPALYWRVALDIAGMFANYGPGKTWNFQKTRVAQTNCVNPNFLHCDRKIGTILSYLAKKGINQYSARLIIRYLLTMEINTVLIIPRPEEKLRQELTPAARARLSPDKVFEEEVKAANEYTTIRVKSPVCTLETPPDRRYGHPDQMLEDSELNINLHYLQQFSPMQITQEIMKVVSYKGIRPRRILINVAEEAIPFLPMTWDIVPGTHAQTASSVENIHKHIKRALCSSNALSLSVKELADQFKKRKNDSVSFLDTDAETELCKRWLKENPVYDPNQPIDYYTPVAINKTIEERSAAFLPKEHKTVYPDDILAYYDTQELDHTLTNVENRYDPVPVGLDQNQLDEYEEIVDELAFNAPSQVNFMEQITNVVNRHVETQRSAPSSSSSSLSSSSSSSSSSSTPSNQPASAKRLPYHRMTMVGDAIDPKRARNSTTAPESTQSISSALADFLDDF